MNLTDFAKEVHENARLHGWWNEECSFGEIIALCHSELSEALEEYRNRKPDVYFVIDTVQRDGKTVIPEIGRITTTEITKAKSPKARPWNLQTALSAFWTIAAKLELTLKMLSGASMNTTKRAHIGTAVKSYKS